MSDFKHKQTERLSRQQAAERLIDIAYALTAGGPLELSTAGRRIRVRWPTSCVWSASSSQEAIRSRSSWS